MSASVEILLENIKSHEKLISELSATGGDTTALETELRNLRKKFSTANEVLTENKKILKG